MVPAFVNQLLTYVEVPGAVSACITLAILGFGLLFKFARWLRRKSRHRDNLLRLACGTSFERFDELLGSPLVSRSTDSGRVVRIYRSPYSYVFATSPGKDDSVDAFSITIRRKRVNLRVKEMTNMQLRCTLMKTRFTDLGNDFSGLRYVIGANRFGYAECYYFGNPGSYQQYVLAFNDAGAGRLPDPFGQDSFANGDLRKLDNDPLSQDLPEWFEGFRASFAPNTFAVIASNSAPAAILSSIGFSVGVDRLDVAHVPD
ncbi:ETEC_3214 domain-containing protein [Actinokineospora sp. HUAS TT18]|uniref:ETEC_3214 domain-containing protein n=1 Tax=Actinokineospora sp. HUAS TT18 TaxID=3447451 RepID=UPI003F51FC0C